MTIINVNSISGINSITAQGASGIEFYDSSGNSVQTVTGDGLTVGTGATISGSTNIITASTNGSERVRVSAGGSVGIGTDDPTHQLTVAGITRLGASIDYGTDVILNVAPGVINFDEHNIVGGRFKINSSGQIGIGSTDPARKLDVVDSGANGAVIRSKITDNNGGYLAYEALNSSGTSVFSVTHNGRINLSENIVFVNGQGIDFSATSDATGMTSELLDDYEEGTFTPTLLGSSGNPTVTYNTTNTHGSYVKVGNLVSFTLEVRTESRTGGSGNIEIGGLPFNAASIGGSEQEYEFPVMFYNVTFDASYIYTAELSSSDNSLIFRGAISGSTDSNLQVSAWSNTNPTLCRISGSYRVA